IEPNRSRNAGRDFSVLNWPPRTGCRWTRGERPRTNSARRANGGSGRAILPDPRHERPHVRHLVTCQTNGGRSSPTKFSVVSSPPTDAIFSSDSLTARSPDAEDRTMGARREAYALLLSWAVIRVGLPMSAGAE